MESQSIRVPLVVIAIPVYKGSWLNHSIESVLSQTYNNWELIIVNDDSPEDIDSIISLYNDPRIHYYINEKNIGGTDLVAQWNNCLSYSNGDFFCLLCDDDFYSPNFLLSMVELSEQYPSCNVFRSRLMVVDSEGNYKDYYPSSPSYETMEDYLWHVMKGYRKQTISEFMWRQNALLKNGGFARTTLAWGADYLSVFQLSQDTGIVSSTAINVFFRDSGHNISSTNSQYLSKKLNGSYDYYLGIKQLIASNCSGDLRQELFQLNEKRLYDHKHWLLETTSITGLLSFLSHKDCEYVSSTTVWEHIISRSFRFILSSLCGVYLSTKRIIKKLLKHN